MTGSEIPNFSFEYLVMRALFDQAFLQSLLQDPAQALESIGIEATPELLKALEKVDVDSLMAVAEAFDSGPRLGQL